MLHRAIVLALFSMLGSAQGIEITAWKPQPQNGRITDPNTVPLSERTLAQMIAFAYGIEQHQIMNLPSWAFIQPYLARAKRGDKALASPAATRAAYQTVLANRFGLKMHPEERDQPVYFLKRQGPQKLKELIPASGGSGPASAFPTTMRQLADQLAQYPGIDRPILDRTGLTRGYSIDLRWTPQLNIFSVLEEQLGLHLEPAMEPMQVWIVDSVRQP